jgi:hypothetical protein
MANTSQPIRLCFTTLAETPSKTKYVIELGCVPTYSEEWISLMSEGYGERTVAVFDLDRFGVLPKIYKKTKQLSQDLNFSVDGWKFIMISVTESFDFIHRYDVPSMYIYPNGTLLISLGKIENGRYTNIRCDLINLGLGGSLKDTSPAFDMKDETDFLKIKSAMIPDYSGENKGKEPFVYTEDDCYIIHIGDKDDGIGLELQIQKAVNPDTKQPLKRGKGLVWCIRRAGVIYKNIE